MNEGNGDTRTEERGDSTGDVWGTIKFQQWWAIHSGLPAHTFRIILFGRIQKTAQVEVHLDDKIVTILTEDNTATVVSGNSIKLYSKGREPQGFKAYMQ